MDRGGPDQGDRDWDRRDPYRNHWNDFDEDRDGGALRSASNMSLSVIRSGAEPRLEDRAPVCAIHKSGSRQKNGPASGAIFPLIVPVTVTLDDERSVAVMPVPAAMQPAIMRVELGTRTIIVAVAIVVPVAADPNAKTLRACDSRRRNSDGR